MKCKIAAVDKSRLTRATSTRAIKSTTLALRSATTNQPNFKIKLKNTLNQDQDSTIHKCKTVTRSSSTTTSSSKGKNEAKSNESQESMAENCPSSLSNNEIHQCYCVCANCGLSINDSGPSKSDESLLRQPVNLGTTNVRQILQCVHNGTLEIKDIILNECNIIYECRICRNLFRSLANFLSHKRLYCKAHQCENMLLFDDKDINYAELDITLLGSKTDRRKKEISCRRILPRRSTSSLAKENPTEQVIETSSVSADTSSYPSQSTDVETVPLKVIQPEKLAAKRKHLELCVNKLLSEKQKTNEQPTLHFTEISTTKNAVYQTTDPSAIAEESQDKQDDFQNADEHVEEPMVISTDDMRKDVNSKDKQSDELMVISTDDAQNNVDNEDRQSGEASKELTNHDDSEFFISKSEGHEESELGKQSRQDNEIYTQSISSVVSADNECSQNCENIKDSAIEIENEPIEIDINKEKLSNQSSSVSSSSSSLSREHSSVRKKPKTFNDEYETKPLPIAAVPCTMCSSKFSSKKTLHVHIRTIHNVQRLIYPCPFCCLTFKQLFNATRHMRQVHKKSKTEVKFLRQAVKSRAYPEVKSTDDQQETASHDSLDDNEQSITSSFDDDSRLSEINEPTTVEESSLGNANCDKEDNANKDDENVKRKENEKEDKSPIDGHDYTKLMSSSSSSTVATTIPDKERKRVNPIIFSCINDCGRYFIKLDSKNQHEKKCPNKPKPSINDEQTNDTNESERGIDMVESTTKTNNNNKYDLIIPDSVYRDIEKVGKIQALRCNSCPHLNFNSKAHLIQHLVLHVGFEVLKCKGCAYQTLNKSELENHLGDAHGIPESLRKTHMVNLSTPLNNDTHVSIKKKPRVSEIYGKNESRKEFTKEKELSKEESVKILSREEESLEEESRRCNEKSSISSGIVIHLRPKISRSRKKKIYEIVGD